MDCLFYRYENAMDCWNTLCLKLWTLQLMFAHHVMELKKHVSSDVRNSVFYSPVKCGAFSPFKEVSLPSDVVCLGNTFPTMCGTAFSTAQ